MQIVAHHHADKLLRLKWPGVGFEIVFEQRSLWMAFKVGETGNISIYKGGVTPLVEEITAVSPCARGQVQHLAPRN